MSKIQQIQSGNLPCSKKRKIENFASKQNFGSGGKTLIETKKESKKPSFGGVQPEFADKMVKAIEKVRISRGDKFKEYLALNEGEIETQLINAVFTTTLAPLVIAYNPVSDKSKEDKKYLAWRQPLSAVIALAGGMPATIAINKQFAKLGSEGYFKNMDIRMCPHGDYLSKEFKAEYNKHKNEPEAFAKELKIEGELSESKSLFARMYNKAKLKNAFTKQKKDEATKFHAELLSSDLKNISINEKKEIVINNSSIAPRKIPRMETMEAVTEYYNNNAVSKRNMGDLMRENFGFEFYGDGKLKPENAERMLSEVLAKDFMEGIGFAKEITPKQLEEITNKYRGKKVPDSEEIAKMMARMIEHSKGETESSKSKITLNQFLSRFEFIDEDDQVKKMKKLQEFMDKPIAKVWEELKEKFKSCEKNLEKEVDEAEKGKIIKTITKQSTKDFTLNLMKKHAKNIEDKFKNINKINGIVANLFVTALTCTVLNWAYPRFMDKFFPKLSASKAKSKEVKGGNK